MGEFTFQAALIQDDHGNATGPIEPVVLSGATQHFRNAYAVVSDDPVTYSRTNVVGTTGEELPRLALDAEGFTFNISNTLTPKGHSNSILGMSDMEVSGVDVECTLTLSSVNSNFSIRFFR